MKPALIFAAAALPLAALPLAAPAFAQPAAVDPYPSSGPTTAATPFMFMAGESDVFEISSSLVALQRSQNSEVRRYATMLIDHHTRTTNVTLAQAKAAGLTPPPPILQAPKRDMITQLLAAPAADFDRTYLSQQVPSHEEALALHTTYAQNGDTPQLRVAARGAIPFVTQHLADARRMLGSM